LRAVRQHSTDPGNVFYFDPSYNGSGADVIDKLAGKGPHEPANPDALGIDKTTNSLIFITTNLMKNEMLGGDHKARGFGHGYETIYLRYGTFVHFSSVLYVIVAYVMNDDDSVRSIEFFPTLYKYRSQGEFAMRDTYDTRTEASFISILTPVGSRDKSTEASLKASSKSYKFGSPCDYYSVLLYFFYDNGDQESLILAQIPECPEDKRFIGVDSSGELNLSSPW
jgi:hypothetical protein